MVTCVDYRDSLIYLNYTVKMAEKVRSQGVLPGPGFLCIGPPADAAAQLLCGCCHGLGVLVVDVIWGSILGPLIVSKLGVFPTAGWMLDTVADLRLCLRNPRTRDKWAALSLQVSCPHNMLNDRRNGTL